VVSGPHGVPGAAPVVVKLGGRALEGPAATRELAAALLRSPGPAVVVHGGGSEVSRWCERMGLAPRFHDGLRVTDPATLEVAAAVLAGLANKRLVAALRAAGVDAVGLAALDGGTLAAVPHPEAPSLGEVGAVAGADPALLRRLLADGRVPVLSSLGADGERLLNLNADDVAAALAAALGASDLVLLSDAPGLVLGGALVTALAGGDVAAVLRHPEVRDGMRPKLRAAARALTGGAARAHIAAWQGPGTLAGLRAGTATCTTIYPAAAPRPA
jgi:acetylglutamate kinase